MGVYFNPGNEGFKKDSQSRLYVDKTLLLKEVNLSLGEAKNCIALSHARRFGKSQAANLLEAYYSKGCDSRELFGKLKISKEKNWDIYLNKFNVIHLDISTFAGNHEEDLTEYIKIVVYEEMAKEYPDADYTKDFAQVLSRVYDLSGAQFVIIIDEWDCVIRNQSDRQELVHRYMQFLHDIFKSAEAGKFLALGYITGIMPIKKIKDESALNNFMEFTMLSSQPVTQYFGFTENEVKELCRCYEMPFDSIMRWYDGYVIDGLHMYNPNSVYIAMLRHKIDAYWKNTSAFETINNYIALNMDGLKDDSLRLLAGEKISVNVNTFQNDLSIIGSKDDALTALIHLGYLGYDAERKKAFMPNYEVETAFHAAIEVGAWKEVAKSLSRADDLLFATIDGEAEKVAYLLDIAHEAYTSILQYNNENSLACTLTMAYATAPAYYNVEREFPTGKGFADIVLLPRRDSGNKPAIVLELKYDRAADTAIRQIKEKRYAGKLVGYAEKILLVGISYDKANKKHQCVIEEYQQ